ncbi:hypothetical protein GQ53DRAFT_498511 [Thozetella sp. PMI_491]|nr:hypothetical protein GQ53DRAFT_498511 [Thozetella sp. PMI_491]
MGILFFDKTRRREDGMGDWDGQAITVPGRTGQYRTVPADPLILPCTIQYGVELRNFRSWGSRMAPHHDCSWITRIGTEDWSRHKNFCGEGRVCHRRLSRAPVIFARCRTGVARWMDASEVGVPLCRCIYLFHLPCPNYINGPWCAPPSVCLHLANSALHSTVQNRARSFLNSPRGHFLALVLMLHGIACCLFSAM